MTNQGNISIGHAQHLLFPDEQLEHAHNIISGKLIHANDIRANEEGNMAAKRSEEYKEKVARYRSFISSNIPSN